mgnify:CR=1 FL=1
MATIGDEKSKSKNAKSEKINVKLNKGVINENDKSENSKSENSKSESKKVKKNDNSVTFIIVEKNGSLKDSDIKESLICAEELSKKCKFKKVDGFIKRTQWSYTSKNEKENVSSKITVELWAKDDGIANSENKYEFPPPVDSELFFGACALVARDSKNNYINLSKDKWNKMYEYLFGGFESLVANDDDEEDELDAIPKNKKTRDGYLKDGFVIDGGAVCDSDVDVAGGSDEDDDDDDDDDESDTDSDKSSENGGDADGDADGDGDGGGDGVYFKKNKNTVPKIVSTKIKLKSKHNVGDNEKYALKEEEDDSGWKTDESSELSEEEYSYTK